MTVGIRPTRFELEPFTPAYAPTIATWVSTERELCWLAPSTPPPLTAEKVMGWLTPGRCAYLLSAEGDATPVAYGELNPVGRNPNHLWIGHVIIRPDRRGRGLGRRFVRCLVETAFAHTTIRCVSLIVFPDNAAAVKCYRHVGFQLAGEEFHDFGRSGQHDRLLRFEIRSDCLQH
ncbi:MAG: GNAT family N-acetyltransferase [Phycisphaerae bacterium]